MNHIKILHSGFKSKMLISALVCSSSMVELCCTDEWVGALFAVPTHHHHHHHRKNHLLQKVEKMRKTCPYNHRVYLPLCPGDGHCSTLVNTGSLGLLHTLRKLLQPRVLRHRALFLLITSHGLTLAKQHEGKQGGDTHGGRGWMSKLIPHVPQEETFQAASAYSAGGRVVEYSKL